MKIALYSSKRERCGISTYTDHLAKALVSLGHAVQYFSSSLPYQDVFPEIQAWRPDVFHAQHEVSIMPPTHMLIEEVRKLGCKAVLTMHTEVFELQRSWNEAFPGHPIVLHRQVGPKGVTLMPMPCPVYDPPQSREALRQKYGIPKDAFVISTVGFMIPWKDHPGIIGKLGPWMVKIRPDAILQVIASAHFNEKLKAYAEICQKEIQGIADRMGGNRIRHISNYPSDEELLERLFVSDLGYVFSPMDTASSSAAGAQFTSARCPLVATDSSHYAALGPGVARAPKVQEAFVDFLIKVAHAPDMLWHLRTHQEAMYKDRNYQMIAKWHLMLYGAP